MNIRRVLLAVLAVVVVGLFVQRSRARHVHEGHEGNHHVTLTATHGDDEVLFSRTFDVAPGGRLDVELGSEDVVVETGSGSQATVTVRGRGRDARAEFERRRFSAEATDGGLRVRTENERRRGFRMGSTQAGFTVVISIPEQFDAAVHVGSGDVQVDRLAGDLDAGTGSGDVTVGRVTGGEISLSTGSGDVEADALQAATVRLSTGSGDIAVGTVDATTVEAGTGSGDVEVGTLSGAVTLGTGSGNVEARLVRVTSADVETGSGDVTLGLPRGLGATFDLSGSSVEADASFGLPRAPGHGRGNVSGRSGDGRVPVTVETGSGSIEIRAN